MGMRWYFSIRMQTEVGSSGLCVLGSLVFIVFNPCVPAGSMGAPGNPAADGEKLESSEDMNSNSYFEAGYCSGPLGLIPNVGKTYWLQQAGARFAP